jgi:hypothetical protein
MLEIKKSKNKSKKYDAIIDGKVISFGARGYQDYTDNNYDDPKAKRELYIKRHRAREDWTTINPGSLSRFILWGDSPDINKNIKDFKKRFNL